MQTIDTGNPMQGNVGFNGSVNLSDGTACTSNAQCAGGYCVHSLCRSSSTSCGDGYCDTGESCSSDSSACGTGSACTNGCVSTAAAAQPTTGGGGGGAAASTTVTTVPPVTTTTIPPVITLEQPVTVTETRTVSDVIIVVPPETLGISQVTAESVRVVKVAEATVTVTAAQTQQAADQALASALTETARTEIQDIKRDIQQGEAKPVVVEKNVAVYVVTSKDTGRTVSVSKVTLTLTAPKDERDVRIIEVIPKSVAMSTTELVFLGVPPVILQADPVVEWRFDEVKQGEKKDLSYTVKKNLTRIDSTTVAAAAAAPIPTTTATTVATTTTTAPSAPEKFDPSFIFYALAVLAMLFAVYRFMKYY